MSNDRHEALIQRLRSQHHDLLQGAYYEPHEDPTWDATLDAAAVLAALPSEGWEQVGWFIDGKLRASRLVERPTDEPVYRRVDGAAPPSIAPERTEAERLASLNALRAAEGNAPLDALPVDGAAPPEPESVYDGVMDTADYAEVLRGRVLFALHSAGTTNVNDLADAVLAALSGQQDTERSEP